ncbi:MAG TPA: deoxyribodipyrimidine photo-lyase [Streptosporangiaceae bacterium]|nr:deoxyribodipyrimidine photo-lyase [Streptosporangiaceae bacterium]
MQTLRQAIMLFTRDLRLHDNPALTAALDRAASVVPLFVLDDRLLTGGMAAPNRTRFLVEAVADLRSSLRQRGGDLIIRRGDPVTEVIKLARQTGAEGVFCADDVSAHAARRRRRLTGACRAARLELAVCPGITVVAPGSLRPSSGGDHYRVFTPYLRSWEATPWRDVLEAPERVVLPDKIASGDLPRPGMLGAGGVSPAMAFAGGESAGRRRADEWLASQAGRYPQSRDDLAATTTSLLSAYLHFGCLSPLALAQAAGPGPFRRQLAWRDFFHQLTAAFPAITRDDYRPGRDSWHDDRDALDAWRHGQTGVPIVDAGQRQLLREGWMHNRSRMITASFLCRRLRIDWRLGAGHFMQWLTDGDVASNYGNWQWTAGTGTDTRPGRVLNPVRQARRFDPRGDYVRRYVPELAGLDGARVHEPWRLPGGQRRRLGYPEPVIGTF